MTCTPALRSAHGVRADRRTRSPASCLTTVSPTSREMPEPRCGRRPAGSVSSRVRRLLRSPPLRGERRWTRCTAGAPCSTGSSTKDDEVLVYLDSSVLARAYLPDEDGHDQAHGLLVGSEHLLVSSTWTVVEVTSALCRTVRGHRLAQPDELLAVLAADTGDDGPVTLLRSAPEQVEQRSLQLVRDHPLRSLDALHLAVAELAAVPLLEPGEQLGLASRDEVQCAAGVALGFVDIWSSAGGEAPELPVQR